MFELEKEIPDQR